MAPALQSLKLKAPPPQAVFLPDSLFFVRVVPIAENTPPEEVQRQVELTLEGMAPFPLAQMYYGNHWAPGSRSAVVYAAYKKRLTSEQVDTWAEAEMVLPAFASLLTAKVDPSTAVVISAEDGVTVLHWGAEPGGPNRILNRPWIPDSSEADRRMIRDELVRSLGGTRNVIDLETPPVVDAEAGRSSFVFRAGELEAPVTREQLDGLDIRDKEDLASRRTARIRDLFLWRAFLACVLAIALAGLLELGLIGGRFWQRSRQAKVEQQAPGVAEIMRAQTLATRIEELSTKRLRPIEMIEMLAEKKPDSILFARATSQGIYTLDVEAYTNSPADVSSYQATLRALSVIDKVDVQPQGIRDGTSIFRLVVTFKPDAFAAPKP